MEKRIEEYTEKTKEILNALLLYIEDESNTEQNYQKLCELIKKYNICNDKHELTLFLHMISKIFNNHNRCSSFISNFERILQQIKKYVVDHLSNSEIFKIFKRNKRILLFLFEEKIICMDKAIIQKFMKQKYLTAKYPQYFSPEIKVFINESSYNNYQKEYFINNLYTGKDEIPNFFNKLPENFDELRKIGENDDHICELIRNDSLDDFIICITKNENLKQTIIAPSIYETNPFLTFTNPTLMEYVTFFGAIKIFNYLLLSSQKLEPSIWPYAIHSNNAEIIHILEENKIEPEITDNSEQNIYAKCLEESIICYHNNIGDYLKNEHFQNDDMNSFWFNELCFKSYNFSFIENEMINECTFPYICKYDYYSLINIILNDENFDVNKILTKFIFIKLYNQIFNGIRNCLF